MEATRRRKEAEAREREEMARRNAQAEAREQAERQQQAALAAAHQEAELRLEELMDRQDAEQMRQEAMAARHEAWQQHHAEELEAARQEAERQRQAALAAAAAAVAAAEARRRMADQRRIERNQGPPLAATQQASGQVEENKSWWQKAWDDTKGFVQEKIVQPVQQAVPKVMDWVDQHQREIALGVGVAAGVAAIVLSGGAATPLVAAAWMAGSAAVAGGLVAAGTVGLNAYYQRPLTSNLPANIGIAAGAAVVTSGLGFALAGGVVQQGLYSLGNTASRLCLAHPTGCARVGAALTLWDKVEDIGLQARLAIQTAQGDPRAADTALELQLERLDNVPGNTTFREVKEALSTLIGHYGDDVAHLVGRFGNEGAELLARHNDNAVDFLSRHLDDADEVANYIEHVVDVDIARLNLDQGHVVSRLSQEYDVPIAITGRWSDTPAEAAWREEAFSQMQDMISKGMDEDTARMRVASEFGINPHQVKKSTGGPEVDVFILRKMWDDLSPDAQNSIRQRLVEAFNTKNRPDFIVDFYQDLPLDKMAFGWPDPRTNIPPGSIIFYPDGRIIHDPFAAPKGEMP